MKRAEQQEITIEAEPHDARSTHTSLTALATGDDGLYVPWHATRPRPGESCRWQRSAREWVAIALGEDVELGQAVVLDSRGQRQCVPSYEDALRLARCWTL